jgi:hypothetical protein
MRPIKIDEKMANVGFIPASIVAQEVGVNLSTIYRSCEAQNMVVKRIGTHWYIKAQSAVDFYKLPGLAEDLQVWIEEHRSKVIEPVKYDEKDAELSQDESDYQD